MAIARDLTHGGVGYKYEGLTGSDGSEAISFEVGTGDNRMLFVFVNLDNRNTVTGITYNGVALTKEVEISAHGYITSCWRLDNPASGNNNVVVSWSGTFGGGDCSICAYTGAKQNGDADAVGSGSGTAQNFNISVTPVADAVWIVSRVVAWGGFSGDGAGTNTTAWGGASLFDNQNYGTIDSPGTPFTLGILGGSSADYNWVAASFEEEPAPPAPAVGHSFGFIIG